jgi:hypothetical protein
MQKNEERRKTGKQERGVLLRAATNFHRQVAMDIAWAIRRKSRRMQKTMKERKKERVVLLRAATNFHGQVAMDIAWAI